MKSSQIMLIILFSVFASTCFGADQKLSVKADFGMYRYGSWNLTIEEYGKAGGAKFYYRANDERARVDAIAKTGKVGQPVVVNTTLSKGQIALIEDVISSKEFSSTEKSLKGEAKFSHGPYYSLQVCLDQTCHKVF